MANRELPQSLVTEGQDWRKTQILFLISVSEALCRSCQTVWVVYCQKTRLHMWAKVSTRISLQSLQRFALWPPTLDQHEEKLPFNREQGRPSVRSVSLLQVFQVQTPYGAKAPVQLSNNVRMSVCSDPVWTPASSTAREGGRDWLHVGSRRQLQLFPWLPAVHASRFNLWGKWNMGRRRTAVSG